MFIWEKLRLFIIFKEFREQKPKKAKYYSQFSFLTATVMARCLWHLQLYTWMCLNLRLVWTRSKKMTKCDFIHTVLLLGKSRKKDKTIIIWCTRSFQTFRIFPLLCRKCRNRTGMQYYYKTGSIWKCVRNLQNCSLDFLRNTTPTV